MKLSPAQEKAMAVIRQNGGIIVTNGKTANRNRITYATLRALEKRKLLVGSHRNFVFELLTK